MLAATVKHRAAVLPLLAIAWVAGTSGVVAPPWLATATVLVGAGLAMPQLRRRSLPAPAWWLAGLLAWACVDAVLRPVAAFDAGRAIAMGATALLLGVAATRPRTAAWGRVAVVAAGLLSAAWLVIERLVRGGRPEGPFLNPNLAATLALLALALAPFLPFPTAARVVASGIALTGVVASGSRGALLGACALAAAWGLARRTDRHRWLVPAVVLVGVTGLALRLATDRDPLRFERLHIWGVAGTTVVAELPFGCGPGGYADAALRHNFALAANFAHFARIPGVAESDVLQALATLGLPGAVLVFGLIASIVRRLPRDDARGWGVVAAVAVTSAFSTQIAAPAVAWSTALALASTLPPRSRRVSARSWALLGCAGTAVAVATSAVLAAADWGAGEAPDRLVDRAAAAQQSPAAAGDARLADAEALLVRACAERPRYGRAWRSLGAVRLERARLRHERDLAGVAAQAFVEALKLNAQDAFAAFGQAQALRSLGDGARAEAALREALTIEPNFVPAWLQLGELEIERGELGAARSAYARLVASQARARAAAFVSDYERALAWADPRLIDEFRRAIGGRS